jgi:hypothetical protein
MIHPTTTVENFYPEYAISLARITEWLKNKFPEEKSIKITVCN